jgi:hypothetical protein
MTMSLEDLVSNIESRLAAIEIRDRTAGFAHEAFEVVQHWTYLGRRALANDTLVNFPEAAEVELRNLALLQGEMTQLVPEARQLYAPLLIMAADLLKILESVEPSEGGHLGIVKTIRHEFLFLETSYGFSATNELPTGVRYLSGSVYIRLRYAVKTWMSCRFGPEPEGEHSFIIEDLLFLYRDHRYRSLPEDLALDTESAVKKWFGTLASIFQKYGDQLLTNAPGIFDHLNRAQAERDSEYSQEMFRLYGHPPE